MDIVATIIRPPAIHVSEPPDPGRTNSRIIMLDASDIGRKVSSRPRLPEGSSGITGGSCNDNSPLGISGGCRRAGRRNTIVLIGQIRSSTAVTCRLQATSRSMSTCSIRTRPGQVVSGCQASADELRPAMKNRGQPDRMRAMSENPAESAADGDALGGGSTALADGRGLHAPGPPGDGNEPGNGDGRGESDPKVGLIADDLCRLTVAGPARTIELAVPVHV